MKCSRYFFKCCSFGCSFSIYFNFNLMYGIFFVLKKWSFFLICQYALFVSLSIWIKFDGIKPVLSDLKTYECQIILSINFQVCLCARIWVKGTSQKTLCHCQTILSLQHQVFDECSKVIDLSTRYFHNS